MHYHYITHKVPQLSAKQFKHTLKYIRYVLLHHVLMPTWLYKHWRL